MDDQRQLVEAFLAADTTAAIRELLARHPELLAPEFVEVLAVVAEEGDEDWRRHVEVRQELLARCRERGVAFALEEVSRRQAPNAIGYPEEFGGDVEELVRLRAARAVDPVAAEQLCRLCESILDRLPLDQDPNFRVALLVELAAAMDEWPGDTRGPRVGEAVAYLEQALGVLGPDPTPYRAVIEKNLGAVYTRLPTGDRARNLERARECFTAAALVLTPEAAPTFYVETRIGLAQAFQKMPTGDRTENLLQAREHYVEALQVRTQETDPLGWASLWHDIGNVYQALPTGDRNTNLNQAEDCYRAALQYRTLEAAPLDHASTQLGLANVYRQQSGDNPSRALDCCHAALRVYSPEVKPFGYACAQNLLGVIHTALPTGSAEQNLHRAIDHFREALGIWTLEAAPAEYASVQTHLGEVYRLLPTGDPTANLERAITCSREALRVMTLEADPIGFATAQNNLGLAYGDLPPDPRGNSYRAAITCHQEALRVWTPDAFPQRYAETQNNLGEVYRAITNLGHSEEQTRTNLELAAACFERARAVSTFDTAPGDYATIMNNLGNTYLYLPSLAPADRTQRAIECYHEALRVWTAEAAPQDYAMAQMNLGVAYTVSPGGDERAVEYFHAALQFYTPKASPVRCRAVIAALAAVYRRLKNWQAALDAYHIGIAAGELVYRAGLSATNRSTQVVATAPLFRNASFTAVRGERVGEALVLLERGKTRLLSEALRLRATRPPGVPAEIWDRFERAAAVVRESLESKHPVPRGSRRNRDLEKTGMR
ncbi:tpr domain protein : TPR domain protein OS=Arthrospira platensis (strain NIES-39 / IAM M-135) GN=NIES39_D03840 PE=4 SV=1: Sel1: Sel1: Sel1 [Gemmata massiliana]|uniref:Tetratricopeptide repeat protein n=1 Tax=Gemmata massiliana TaxID=1210884 RepID=A0A6P2CXU3_9BACT|nr:hypothetical protein [Gemmata massiliana]VTR92020.1 tpr domain protein : TPR domain protein OS=Arthrospira platensis (strain NIES-39 / IAM M-135) GN=NIES39_D03840 PE=4 SV=1: Sel1: Sel1: Sel1 [Gemmata massiliana]